MTPGGVRLRVLSGQVLVTRRRAVAHHATRISRAAAAGVLISGRDDNMHHVGASSADAHLLELFQIQNAEGRAWTASAPESRWWSRT